MIGHLISVQSFKHIFQNIIQLEFFNFQQKTIIYLYLTPYKLLPNLQFSHFGHILEQYCFAMNDHNLYGCVY